MKELERLNFPVKDLIKAGPSVPKVVSVSP